MTKSKFNEHQIISILKQTENGRTVAEVCRENSISSSTYFKWKKLERVHRNLCKRRKLNIYF